MALAGLGQKVEPKDEVMPGAFDYPVSGSSVFEGKNFLFMPGPKFYSVVRS
jgi:hypothetical protein